MCQPKSKGGKRCDAHLRGSSATLGHVSAVTGEDRETVRAVFNELRKEGKELNKPTPEQVREFAESQRFQAAFSPELTEAQRTRISGHWEEAAKEEPSAGTFHAWKYTLSEVMRRARTKVAAVFAAGLLSVSLASCSGGGALNEDVTPGPSQPPAMPSPSAEATDPGGMDLNEYGISIDMNEKMGIAANGPEFTDAYGTYNRVSIEDGSPILEPTPGAYDELAQASWGEEKLAGGEVATKKFILEKILDNQSVYEGTPEKINEYLEEGKSYVAQEWQEAWMEYDKERLESQGLSGGRADASVSLYLHYEDASFPEHEKGQPRYTLTDITLKEAVANTGYEGASDVIYKYDITYQRPANIRDTDGGYSKGFINVTHEQWLSVDATADGKYELTGWWAESHAVPFTADGEQAPLWSMQQDGK